MFGAGALAMVVSELAAYLFEKPVLFSSPSPRLSLFFEASLDPTASPRNIRIRQLVVVLAAALPLGIFGLLGHPSIFQESLRQDSDGREPEACTARHWERWA
ncbi:MAG: hypothetical protein JOZ19_07295 [Rubrobacter sp.]|nr:hypothetical protein [Rubrobacter sp.]